MAARSFFLGQIVRGKLERGKVKGWKVGKVNRRTLRMTVLWYYFLNRYYDKISPLRDVPLLPS